MNGVAGPGAQSAGRGQLASGPAGQTQHAHDRVVTALILGIAAMMWFGWGQAQPPGSWRIALMIGTFASIAVAGASGARAFGLRGSSSAMADPRARRRYWLVVGPEFAACGIGAVVVTATGHSAYVAPWILVVVGIHFLPLAQLFGTPELTWGGLALTVVAIAATVTGAITSVAPSAVAGGLGGLTCLAVGAICLVRARTS
jgi:hypothetical protein